jgi:hypothetical protein
VADKDPDAKQGSKVLVFMYKVKCENVGVSKDSLFSFGKIFQPSLARSSVLST